MNIDLYNIIGFTGTGLYIFSYFLLQTKKISHGKIYTALNLTAAIAVSISLIKYWNAPSLLIQITWIIISLYGLFLLYKDNNKDFDSIHLLIDIDSKDIPKYFVTLKNNKVKDVYQYSSKNIWEMIKDNNNVLSNDDKFFNDIQVPSYTTPPPYRGEVAFYEDCIRITNKEKIEEKIVRKNNIIK